MNTLRVLIDAGLHLRADGNRLIVAPAERLTDPLRALIRQHKAELLEAARVASQAGDPLMSREQADRAHWPAWDGAEIDRAVSRIHLFIRRGIDADQAENLAERLTLRDREQDTRQSCAECRHGRSDRCPDGAPLPADVLHCCPHFKGTP